jgi:hypothetical protein
LRTGSGEEFRLACLPEPGDGPVVCVRHMIEPTATTRDTVIIRVPGGAEISWRIKRMVSLGADAELAAKIADSDADVHDIERLLKAGCPLELAWTIVRPVDKPQAAASTAADSAA